MGFHQRLGRLLASVTFLLEWADAMDIPFADFARQLHDLWTEA
jgi:hypothetical protein